MNSWKREMKQKYEDLYEKAIERRNGGTGVVKNQL